ncbi:unnamed protein product [Brassica rapa subsp. narinosa]
MVTTPEKSISQFRRIRPSKSQVGSDREVIRTGGSLAMVQETENDDLERDVKLRTLEGDDLKWVNWEERKMMMKEMEKRRFRNGGSESLTVNVLQSMTFYKLFRIKE